MLRSLALVGLIVVAGALGAWGSYRFPIALNDPNPPLAQTMPLIEPAPTTPLSRKVLVVLVDGFRRDASYGHPALDGLRQRGIDIDARAPFPTISKANYVTVGSGVPPRFSGARTNDGFVEHAIDSVFARAEATGRKTAYVADRTRGLARLFDIEDRTVEPLGDALTIAVAATLARADLVLWKLMEVDVAGHAFGASSTAYRDAVRAIDAQLASTIATFDFTRDTIIVVADHGHTDRGGHGGEGDDVERIPFIIAGAGVRAPTTVLGQAGARASDRAVTARDTEVVDLSRTGDRAAIALDAEILDHGPTSSDAGAYAVTARDAELIDFAPSIAGSGTNGREPNLVDLAPTVSALLGIPAPGHALGHTLVDALAIDGDQRAALRAADARRHAHLAPVLAQIEANDAAVYRRTLMWRVPVAVLAIIALGWFAHRESRRRARGDREPRARDGGGRVDRRVLLVAAVFPVVYFAWVFGVDRLFALPSVPASRVSIWGLTWLAGAVAGGAHAIAMGIVASHKAQRDVARRLPLAPVLAAGLLATCVPAILAWAVAGPSLATMLPRTEWMLLAPAAYASLAYYVVATLLGAITRLLRRA